MQLDTLPAGKQPNKTDCMFSNGLSVVTGACSLTERGNVKILEMVRYYVVAVTLVKKTDQMAFQMLAYFSLRLQWS